MEDTVQSALASRLVSGPAFPAAEAPALVPCSPGYYAVRIDNSGHLPSPYGALLEHRATELVYIGIATVSLHKRLVEQDLRHKSPSTFFRAIGPILGYRPPVGSLAGKGNQNNYKFTAADTDAIILWIDQHLSVSWVEARPALEGTEASLIRAYRPILNTSHNPEPVAELAILRAECRRIAIGSPRHPNRVVS